MTRHDVVDSIAERLREVARTTTAPSVAEQAQRLISRLNSPVRVVLLGMPDALKLEVMNALAAGPALPEAARNVTVELRYGAVESAEITFSDGSVVSHDGALDDESLDGAALVVVERPFPVLKRTSILNLVASADPTEQQSAISWAAKRTDIAIWCSRTFGREDRLVWSEVPDRIRDHGYLVLTGCGDDQAAVIKSRHRDEFVDVYAVDPSRGEAESGVGELADRIAYHAELGRRADTDSAMMFLKANGPRERSRPRVHSRPLTKPRPNSRPQTKPRPEPAPIPAPEIAASHVAAVEVAPEARKKPAAPVPMGLYRAGFSYIRDRGNAMFREIQAERPADDDTILAHCGETLTHLSDLLSSHEEAGAAGDLADTVMEAENLVILLGNERGEEAALDAVSILLQIRREFEVGLAA